jgi:selenocysteine lyase/cysteine desulfurase
VIEPIAAAAPGIERARMAFPALQKVVYLNTGTYGLMPEPAVKELLKATRALERFGVACPINLGGIAEETRHRIAALIRALPEEIAFTRNSTDGINLVLAGLEWREGDEVITSDEEHEALLHPLLFLQKQRGIRIRRVPVIPESDRMLEQLNLAASPHTRLVAVSHVSCETGLRLPAADICAWAESRGILSLIDATQSAAVFPVDVNRLGCDFLTTNGHKWLSGPTGTGIFYVRRARLDDLIPAHVGAGSLERADPSNGTAELRRTAARFEFGTRSWALAAGLHASLAWLEGLGWQAIERHMADLSSYLKDRLAARPFIRLLTPREWESSSALTSFSVEGFDAAQVCDTVRRKWRIHTRVVPHYNAIRVSTAHYNNCEDIDCLISALDSLWACRHRK